MTNNKDIFIIKDGAPVTVEIEPVLDRISILKQRADGEAKEKAEAEMRFMFSLSNFLKEKAASMANAGKQGVEMNTAMGKLHLSIEKAVKQTPSSDITSKMTEKVRDDVKPVDLKDYKNLSLSEKIVLYRVFKDAQPKGDGKSILDNNPSMNAWQAGFRLVGDKLNSR